MNFAAPLPFTQALNAAAARSLLPTTGMAAELQKLDSAIKRRAMFSATVDLAEPLQKLDDGINAILRGEVDQASVRLGMKQLWEKLGYVPDPEHAGGLRDLSSTKRIDLQIETNVDTSRGFGHFAAGQQADVLDEWPAQELFRAFNPKGSMRNWAERWAKAGGEFYGGLMIALKTDEVWQRLGDPDLFPDGLGNPYPPFAWSSGMDVRDRSRDDAIKFGLIDANTQLTPTALDFNADLRASSGVRSANLRSMIEATGRGVFDSEGVFHFKPESFEE
jgi:hypothetical protein